MCSFTKSFLCTKASPNPLPHTLVKKIIIVSAKLTEPSSLGEICREAKVNITNELIAGKRLLTKNQRTPVILFFLF